MACGRAMRRAVSGDTAIRRQLDTTKLLVLCIATTIAFASASGAHGPLRAGGDSAAAGAAASRQAASEDDITTGAAYNTGLGVAWRASIAQLGAWCVKNPAASGVKATLSPAATTEEGDVIVAMLVPNGTLAEGAPDGDDGGRARAGRAPGGGGDARGEGDAGDDAQPVQDDDGSGFPSPPPGRDGGWQKTRRTPGILVVARVRPFVPGEVTAGSVTLLSAAALPQLGVIKGVSRPVIVPDDGDGDAAGGNSTDAAVCACVLTSTSRVVCARLPVPRSLEPSMVTPWVSDAVLRDAEPTHVAVAFGSVRAPVTASLASAAGGGHLLVGALSASGAAGDPDGEKVPLLFGAPLQCPREGDPVAADRRASPRSWTARLDVSAPLYHWQPFALSGTATAKCFAAHDGVPSDVVVSTSIAMTPNQTQPLSAAVILVHHATNGSLVWGYPSTQGVGPLFVQSIELTSAPQIVPAAHVRDMLPTAGRAEQVNDMACFIDPLAAFSCLDACTGEVLLQFQVPQDGSYRGYGSCSLGAAAVFNRTTWGSAFNEETNSTCGQDGTGDAVLVLPFLGAYGSAGAVALWACGSGDIHATALFNAFAEGLGRDVHVATPVFELAPTPPVLLPRSTTSSVMSVCFMQAVKYATGPDNSFYYVPLSWEMPVATGTYATCVGLDLAATANDRIVAPYSAFTKHALITTAVEGGFVVANRASSSGMVFVTGSGVLCEVDTVAGAPDEVCDAPQLTSVSLFDHPMRHACQECVTVVAGISPSSDYATPFLLVGAAHLSPGVTFQEYPSMFPGVRCLAASDEATVPLGSTCRISSSDLWFPNGGGSDTSESPSIVCVDSANGNQFLPQHNDDSGDAAAWHGPVESVPFWGGGSSDKQTFAVECPAYLSDGEWRTVAYVVLSFAPTVGSLLLLAWLWRARRRRRFIGVLTPLSIASGCGVSDDIIAAVEGKREAPAELPASRCRRGVALCCAVLPRKRRSMPAVTVAALHASLSRFVVFATVAWVCGATTSAAMRSWAGLPVFDFFGSTNDDCSSGSSLRVNLNFAGSPIGVWTLVVLFCFGISWLSRRSPTRDSSMRFMGLMCAVPLMYAVGWFVSVDFSMWTGLGPGLAVSFAGGPTVMWSAVAAGQALSVPIRHPYMRRQAPWRAMLRAHRAGIVLIYIIGAFIALMLCTPLGAWSARDPSLVIAPSVLLALTLLLCIESRATLVGAVEAWRRLGGDLSVATRGELPAEPEADGIGAEVSAVVKRYPAVLMRVHGLASLLPVVLLGEIGGTVLLATVSWAESQPVRQPLPSGALGRSAMYQVMFVLIGVALLRQIMLQHAVKQSGENALLIAQARSLKLPPLFPAALVASLAAMRRGNAGPGTRGSGERRDKPSVFTDLSIWATSWSGMQVLGFTSHALSIASIATKLASGNLVDEHGAACLTQELHIQPVQVGIFGLCISSFGLLVSLHTVLSRHFLQSIARVVPVDDSFRLTVSLKTTAVALCVAQRPPNSPPVVLTNPLVTPRAAARGAYSPWARRTKKASVSTSSSAPVCFPLSCSSA